MRDFPDKKKLCYPNAFYFLEVQNAKLNLREHFFKKIQDPKESERIRKWILRFFTKQINPRSLRSLCVKGTEESFFQSGFFGSFDAP